MGDEPAAEPGVPAGIAGSPARVGGYRVERQLGRGGMAVVYLARDERLDRPVALKILASALATDEAFRERFIRESRAAAAVEDPHIIPVFDAGEEDGLLYIAMRYVPGGDVGTIVRRPAGAARPGSRARDGAQRRPENDRALRHVSDASGKLTAEGGFPVRTQTARLSGAGATRHRTPLLVPGQAGPCAFPGRHLGRGHWMHRALFLANQLGQHGYSILGGLVGAAGGWMIGHFVAKRQAAAKAAATGDGVTVIPLDSVTGWKAWRSTGISGRLGSGSLVVTTTGGGEYRFSVQPASWSADLTHLWPHAAGRLSPIPRARPSHRAAPA